MILKNCDVYELKKNAIHKRLVCFGIGKVFYDFLEDFSEMEFEEDIWAVVDNKADIDTEVLLPNGTVVKLMNPEKLSVLKHIIILISCADIAGVCEQLEQYRLSDEIDCYAIYFVRSQTNRSDDIKRKYPSTFKISEEQKIPKTIHYCWFGNNSIPKKNLKWMESWKIHCPDYQIIRWDESNYDITKNAYIYEAYKAKKWGFVSDYARIDVVYHYGGIYLDTDVELLKPYDELLFQPAFCGIEASRKIALGLGFGAEKSCKILKELLHLYEGIYFTDKCGNNNLTTCVTLQHPFYKKRGFISNGEYQIIDELTVFPETVFSPKDLYTGETRITQKTFSIHHYDGSWADRGLLKRIEETKNFYWKLKQNKWS